MQQQVESAHIKPVHETDYDTLIEIWEASVRATHDFLSEDDIQFFKPLIRNNYFQVVKLSGLWNAENILCGFAGTADRKLEMLFLHPAATGKGWGKLLIAHVMEQDSIDCVDVNEQNKNAVRFYLHMGFEVVNRLPVDGMGKPFPLLQLQLKK